MSTIHRYIFRELFKTFFFGLIIFTAILVLIMVAREAVAQGIPPVLALRMVPYMLLEQFRYSVPMMLLLASTTFFARMAGSNEIIALKSAGIPPWKIIWPVVAVSCFISGATIWINEVGISWGKDNITRILVAGAEEIIYNNLRSNHSLAPSGSGLSITVKGVENKVLLGPTITLKDFSISAQKAEIKTDYTKEEMTFILYNLYGDVGNGGEITAKEHHHTISLSEIVPESGSKDRPSEMPLRKIPEAIENNKNLQKSVRDQMSAQVAFSTCLGDYENFVEPAWVRFFSQLDSIDSTINRLYLEPQRRYSTGFSCLFFVWIGANLAIFTKRADIFSSFFACFIPILILYYPFLMLGIEGGKKGTIPPVFMWTGNLCIGLIGYWFFKKIHRY